MLKTLSTEYRKSTRFITVLESTIQNNGWNEFVRLTRESVHHPSSDPEIIPSLSEFWNRTKNDVLDLKIQLKKWVHKPGLVPGPQVSQAVLNGISISSGFCWALVLSHKDLKLFTSNQKKNAIFLHRPLVLGSNVILNWMLSMLEQTKNHPDLHPSEKQKIDWLEGQIHQFKKGVSLGNYRKDLLIKFLRSTKLVRSRRNVDLKVDPEFFSWLNYAISQEHE